MSIWTPISDKPFIPCNLLLAPLFHFYSLKCSKLIFLILPLFIISNKVLSFTFTPNLLLLLLLLIPFPYGSSNLHPHLLPYLPIYHSRVCDLYSTEILCSAFLALILTEYLTYYMLRIALNFLMYTVNTSIL